MGLATARHDGFGDGSGTAIATVRRGWRRRGVEAKGGIDDGDGDGGTEGGDIEGGDDAKGKKIGQPDGAKKITAIRVSRRCGTSLIPNTLLVSTDIMQRIPKM
jgi:hypothetical protein